MAITQSIETINSKLGTIPIKAGQIIYVRDRKAILFDSADGTRVAVEDIIPLDTDAQRIALIAPLSKLYLVKDTKKLWYYNGAWASIGGNDAPTVKYIGAFAISNWTGAAAPHSIKILASTHGKGINPNWNFYNNEYFEVTVSSVGDLTIYTNTKKAMTIVIN